VPQLIDEIFGQILVTAAAISDPFEQAFFVTFDTEEVLLHLARDMVPENDREHFLKITKEEIAALHEGNFARYRLRPAEFNDWQNERNSGHLRQTYHRFSRRMLFRAEQIILNFSGQLIFLKLFWIIISSGD
jgi:hypothetical protein